jgi:hypothetical protein
LRPGLPDFSWYNIPKLEKCTILTQNIINGHKITIQSMPKLLFLVMKYTLVEADSLPGNSHEFMADTLKK